LQPSQRDSHPGRKLFFELKSFANASASYVEQVSLAFVYVLNARFDTVQISRLTLRKSVAAWCVERRADFAVSHETRQTARQ